MPESDSWDSCEEIEVLVHRYVFESEAVPVTAVLRYRTADPFAVTMEFLGTDRAPVVKWTFSRDLLLEGINHACGEGDIRVWPMCGPTGTRLCILLVPSDRSALMTTPLAEIVSWLKRTTELVPPGTESDLIDWSALRNIMLP
ncbi:SsgA family sporulation/cell division regulator [Streptomyces sp. NPDC004787]|uniref:SsgA family sporulation/cell division regulator n=1 Tax=Streptomyces sp. NPDC004787 TaxID=3154291 RepID=UPI0033AB91FB